MKRGNAVDISVIVCLFVTGCGSSGQNMASAPPRGAQASPSSSPTPSIPPRDLKPQLLTVADLPAGWAVDNSNAPTTTTPQCLKNAKAVLHITDRAEADFEKGTDLPSFSQTVGFVGTAAAAAAKYQAAAAIFNGCKTISYTVAGTRVTGSIGPMSFAKFGNRSGAWQVVLTAQGQTVGLFEVLVQKGPELTSLQYVDYDAPILDDATTFVTRAVARMPAN